ncbi:MAG: hypothetical protein ABSD31_17760 [Candidatus Binataceae bacterium]
MSAHSQAPRRDNSIHISEIHQFIERLQQPPDPVVPHVPADEARNVETICELVAQKMVPDRARIQVGVGSTSGMLMPYLARHHDLGMQTEIIPQRTATLVRKGVVTGKYKEIFLGLVVGSAFAAATARDELDYVNGHPGFHLYDFNVTDDIRLIAREEE